MSHTDTDRLTTLRLRSVSNCFNSLLNIDWSTVLACTRNKLRSSPANCAKLNKTEVSDVEMIPVVDIGAFVEAMEKAGGQEGAVSVVQNQPEVKDTARLVHDAVCQYGFCYLDNHGLPQYVLDGMFSSSKQFFELDPKIKERYARGGDTNHGWVSLEREKLNENRPHADLKEAFNFSPCEEKEWPSEVPGMAASFNAMFHSCHVLSSRVLDLMGVALELKDCTMLSRCHQLCGKKGSYTSLRSLYYPPCTNMKEGQIQCGEHSDYGSITLLFQDGTAGLQIVGKDGEYHDVKPVPGAVLVNVGDLIQRWTADKYPATKHRVIVPPQAAAEGRARQSLAFFCHPDDATLITCLDGSNMYPPITSYDYLMSRFAATY